MRPTASGDRSKHFRYVARSPNHNQSYDQAIVRSGVTVALDIRNDLLAFIHTKCKQQVANACESITNKANRLFKITWRIKVIQRNIGKGFRRACVV